MSESYGWDDIITSPYDERLKVGEKYYMYDNPMLLIQHANNPYGQLEPKTLTKINCCSDYPFVGEQDGEKHNYIHCMKVREQVVKPYEFSDPQVRQELLGRIVSGKINDLIVEGTINAFEQLEHDEWRVTIGTRWASAETLCESFTFNATGRKVGVYED